MRIYVGNLNYRTSDDALAELFGQHGQVEEAVIMMDRETGRSRGFAFVTMADESAGRNAIEEVNGTEFEGRTLVVNEARPRQNRDGGGGGGGYRDRH